MNASLKFGLLIAVTTAAVLFGVTARSASAIEGSLRIESKTAFVGETVSVDIFADVGPPGLGAWTVDPIWDDDVLSPVSCAPFAGAVCSDHFGSGEGRVTGASATGLVGETKLATYFFRCGDRPGVSSLELSVEVFADATPDAPADINETVTEGQITCLARGAHYGTLEVGSQTLPLGETGQVAVTTADIPTSGIGAWTFDVAYDPDVLSVQDCAPLTLLPDDPGSSTCSFDTAGAVHVEGSPRYDTPANPVLANITVTCEHAGRSELQASVAVWRYPTTSLVPPSPEIVAGFVLCVGPDTPAPIATPAAALPPAGGNARNGSMPTWLFVALAAVGAGAAAAGVVAARRRA